MIQGQVKTAQSMLGPCPVSQLTPIQDPNMLYLAYSCLLSALGAGEEEKYPPPNLT